MCPSPSFNNATYWFSLILCHSTPPLLNRVHSLHHTTHQQLPSLTASGLPPDHHLPTILYLTQRLVTLHQYIAPQYLMLTECAPWSLVKRRRRSKWIGSWASGAFFFSRVWTRTSCCTTSSKNWKFRNFGFFGLKGWVASPKDWNFRNFWFLGTGRLSGQQKIEIFEISTFLVLRAG